MPLPSARSVLRSVLRLVIASVGLSPLAAPLSLANEQASTPPPWLQAHVGEGAGEIAPVVLQRARALYLRKSSQGRVNNPCYFAMDATRPSDGPAGARFYTICEAQQVFRAVTAGHGSGRDLSGLADFANDRRCARNFSNAQDSLLTAGGNYVTAETKTSFKGYYRTAAGRDAVLTRAFVQFDGEGAADNARARAIGGHAAEVMRGLCLRRAPDSPHANADGYVPVGTLVEYATGRSNGCTSWSSADAAEIVPLMRDDPTTVHIYPEADDIAALARASTRGGPSSRTGVYWNASCLRQIGSPRFWPRETLEPLIARYEAAHPAPRARPLPICKGS